MSGRIPKKSSDCSRCAKYGRNGRFEGFEPCADHPNGDDYSGPELYEPSEWVQHVVGRRYYGAFNDGIFLCTGYDVRAGFWMRNVEDPLDLRNVSERAIDRTYNRVR